MRNSDLDDTQPTHRQPQETGETQPTPVGSRDLGATRPSSASPPRQPAGRPRGSGRPNPTPAGRGGSGRSRFRLPDLGPRWRWLYAAVPFSLALFVVTVLSSFAGYSAGRTERNLAATAEAVITLQEQYTLALEDMQAGRYELARQRLEFIFTKEPEFQDAADLWVEVSLILMTTATPTGEAPTITPTPTIDPRPVEELFQQAQRLAAAQDWDALIETLLSLRHADPTYHYVEVDGMIYLALRNRGADKILNQGNLEGGLYDFSLAEKYGPLDAQAEAYRQWARLYLIGNSFWYAYPQLAAQYYGQVAAAAPNLKDASGWAAYFRYWVSLLHYGDQLAEAGDWCQAAAQYQRALDGRNDATVQATRLYAGQQCQQLTPSLTPTPTLGLTITPSLPAGDTPTSTATTALAPSDTPPGGPTATPSATGLSPTPTPSATLTPEPTDTP